MRRYIYIVILGILVSFTSCTMTDVDVDIKVKPSANSGLQFIGAAEDFDLHTVGTRADEEVSDSHISEMTLLIFRKDGTMLPAVSADQKPLPSSHININKSNPTFLIEANKYEGTGILASMEAGIEAKYYDNTPEEGDDNLTECKIYIVANAYHLIGERLERGEIKTENQLKEAILDVGESLAMPIDDKTDVYRGLPMIGVAWAEGDYNDDGTRKNALFNLEYKGGNTTNDVATIPLKKLYSKICFTMQVNSFQYVQGGQIPEFKLTNVEVFNVPNKVRMDYKAGNYVDTIQGGGYWYEPKPNSEGEGESGGFSLLGTSLWPKRIVTKHDSSDKIEFHFFMPEHKVTPFFTEDNYDGYPDNLPKDRRQYYKPKLVAPTSVGGVTQSKIATFVRIHGDYTTHNGEILQVSYDIYLGQDEVDDFEVKRNQQLNNIITINGLTNHKDAYGDDDTTTDNISIDHRVQVTNLGYLLSMERETILDSHFEVRPLDITLSPGRKMTIQIPGEYKDWLAMESDAEAYTGANSPYVSNVSRRGVRKYFTTNLVSELWNDNSGKIAIEHSGRTTNTEIHRIWFYIDENPNVYDKTASGLQTGESGYTVTNQEDKTNNRIAQTMYRLGKVNFYLSDVDSEPDTSKPNSTVNFQQWNLWRVWNKDGNRYYDIEHEEEYLNNYASDQAYRPSQDGGMAWGLDGLQLSDTVESFGADAGFDFWFIDELIDMVVESGISVKPYYDFYNTREEATACGIKEPNGKFFPYNGYNFCKKIIAKANASSDSNHHISELWLPDQPKSAVEYCYNKNKRNAKTGKVDDTDLKWYLPAIDEIQDIASQCYAEFDRVFQENFYWSSQPAYKLVQWYYQERIFVWVTIGSGDLYYDNMNYARATRAIADNLGGFTYEPSRMTQTSEQLRFRRGQDAVLESTGLSNKYDLGYKSRTAVDDHCRVRAVYRSGTGTRAQ